MKKIFIAFFVILVALMTSCDSTRTLYASNAANECYLGMTINEFKSVASNKASLEVMEYGYTVFKMNDWDSWDGALLDTKFFYFDSYAKLVKIDGGEFIQERYQVEIINR